MKESQASVTIATVVMVTSLVGLLAAGFYYSTNSRRISQQIAFEQRADSLLSANRQIEENSKQLQNQLSAAQEENNVLNDQMTGLNELLARNFDQLRVLRGGKIDKFYTIRQMKWEAANLTRQRDSTADEWTALDKQTDWLNQSNELLVSQNNELEQSLKQRTKKLLTMVPRSALTGNMFLVEAVKSNDKATAKAKKVDGLTISLNVPTDLRLEGMQKVYLSLTDAQNKTMMTPLRTIPVSLPDAKKVIPVHAVQAVNFAKNPRRVSFHLDADADIKPGVYRASVYTDESYLGSVEFRLRDSFWFF